MTSQFISLKLITKQHCIVHSCLRSIGVHEVSAVLRTNVFLYTVLGVIGSGCDTIESVTDIALSWPDISFIVDVIQDVFDILELILDFYDDLQAALDAELCMENPFELLAEWELLE